ncbi:MAG: hypothetical protein F6K42_10210 [Leptolyngbya sp. SIO1D8]|nr:hypothetical protein [Leptolyngbya sp. SIO1D8]
MTSMVACQSPSATETPEPEASAVSAETEGSDIDEVAATQVFPDDFSQVCNGIALTSAKGYQATAGEVHHLYVFDRENDSESFSKSYKELPDGWEMEWEESQETQLVACLTATQQTLANTCEFEPEGEETDLYVLETYSTTYDVAIYAAQSGEQLDSTTFELEGEECPVFHLFTEGELTDTSNADYSQALLEFVKPYVQPEA